MKLIHSHISFFLPFPPGQPSHRPVFVLCCTPSHLVRIEREGPSPWNHTPGGVLRERLHCVTITKYNNVTVTKQNRIMPTPKQPPKKPGRPAKLGQAMSDQLRAAAYRSRRYEAASMAHENPKAANTPVLLAALARQIKAMADLDHAPVARDIAALIVKELCERYEIPFPQTPTAITSPPLANKKVGYPRQNRGTNRGTN